MGRVTGGLFLWQPAIARAAEISTKSAYLRINCSCPA
jgi:hypothetical protein